MKCFVQNNLVTIDVASLLLEELVEIIVERMAEGDDSGAMEGLTESNLQENMSEKDKKAHRVLVLSLMIIRKSMEVVEMLYKFFLRWPAAA